MTWSTSSGVMPARSMAALAVGSLASHVRCRAQLCVPLPAAFSPELGASLSTAFLTAIYGLQTLAQLQPGDTVLIHAAAGGVGQAALQVARRCGARIFATASQAKQAALLEQGVEAVFDSRNTAFAEQLLQATGGSGQQIRTRISAVDPSVMAPTQLLMAQAPLPVGGDQWPNGLRLRARVELGSRSALAVPFAAVTRLAGQSFVYVIGNRSQLLQRPGQVDRQQLASLPAQTLFALQVPVQLGDIQDNRYPVLAGLSPGQRVVTSGLLMLRHGTPVRPR